MDTETASATPRSPVSVAVTARDHQIIQDKPPGSGGQDKGMMASELLLASLLSCQHSTFVKVAAKRRVDATVERIDAELSFDEKGDFDAIHLTWRFSSVGDGVNLETLIRLTERACTVSRALETPITASIA